MASKSQKNVLLGIVVATVAGPQVVAADLEEVVVTAQRREEAVTDIGMSITAIGGDLFQSLKMRDAIDVAAQSPGLTAMNATISGTPIFAIRGMGLDDFFQNNNSSVALYIDGVPMSTPGFMNGAFFDIERVEVLKGPQGTLYGKNAAGGVVHYITKNPTPDPEGHVSLGYGNFGAYDVNAALSGGLSESVQGRLAVTYRNTDSWQRDLDTGRGFGQAEQLGIRGKLTARIGDSFTATLIGRYTWEDSIPASSQVQHDEVAADRFGGVLPDILDLNGFPVEGMLDTNSSDPRDVRVGDLKVSKKEWGTGATLNLVWEIDDVSVTSISAWDRHRHYAAENIDGAPAPNFEFNPQYADASQVYQELRADFSTGERIDWIAGLNYIHDEIEAVEREDFSTVSGAQVYLYEADVFTAKSQYDQKNDSYGAYVNATAHVADKVELIGGVRYSDDRRTFKGQATNTFSGFTFPVTSADDEKRESKVNYRVGVNYKAIDDLLLYANAGTGYKNGIFYAGPPLNPASWAYVPSEDVKGFEVGFKWSGDVSEGITLSAAYFNYDISDRQGFLVFVTPPNLLGAGLGSIPESSSKGFEAEVVWQATEKLNLRVGVANLDAKVTKPPSDVRGYPLASPIKEGTTLSLSPDWSVSSVARYETTFAEGSRFVGQFDYWYRTGITGALGDPNAISGSRSNLGARFTFDPANTSWSFSIWGRNLTDRNDEIRSITDFFGGRSVIRQMPRTYGAEASFRF